MTNIRYALTMIESHGHILAFRKCAVRSSSFSSGPLWWRSWPVRNRHNLYFLVMRVHHRQEEELPRFDNPTEDEDHVILTYWSSDSFDLLIILSIWFLQLKAARSASLAWQSWQSNHYNYNDNHNQTQVHQTGRQEMPQGSNTDELEEGRRMYGLLRYLDEDDRSFKTCPPIV